MRGLVLAEQPADGWFEDVLRRHVLAGRWREAARLVPGAAAQLERAADRQSAVGAALMQKNLDATLTNQIQGRVRMPLTSGGRKPNGTTEMGEAADSHSVLRRLGLRL